MGCPAQFLVFNYSCRLTADALPSSAISMWAPSYIQVHNPTGNISHKHPPDFAELQSNTWP